MLKRCPVFSFLILALVVLSSCAETELASHVYKTANAPPPQGTFKIGNPYKVEGRWYKPQETYSYTETGIASWYGAEFHGRKTANGEKFDKNELTAAHRTLQMPSLVRVTNLDNGRALVVRINDRGPFKRGRIIDVSQKAAELLGFKGRGTAKVRIDLLADESKTLAMAAKRGADTKGYEVAMNQRSNAPLTGSSYQPISTAPQENIQGHVESGKFFPDPVVSHVAVHPTSIYVQAGSFGNAANAEGLGQKLKSFGNPQIYPVFVQGKQFYRVRLGPVKDVPQADALLARLASAGYKQAIIIVD